MNGRSEDKKCEDPITSTLLYLDGDTLHTNYIEHSLYTWINHINFIRILYICMYFKPYIVKT